MNTWWTSGYQGDPIPGGVAIKTYLDPARNHTPFSTGGASGGSYNGPHTDYAINATSFGTYGQSPGLTQIPTGTSNLILIGEKAMDPNYYQNNYGWNWDETIFSGAYGGPTRGWNWGTDSGNGLYQDTVGDNFSNNWGSPFPSGFRFCSAMEMFVSSPTPTKTSRLSSTRSTM